MTSAKDMMTKYEHSPFTLWELRGSEFVILENLPISGDIREKEEISEKSGKPYKAYYIQIENGLFHKDLKLFESELLALFLHTPKGLQNFQGSIFKVDKLNKLGISYQGQAAQDINGNPIGAPRTAPPVIPESEPQDILTKVLIDMNAPPKQWSTEQVYVILGKYIPTMGECLRAFEKLKTEGFICERKPGIWSVT